MCPLRFLILAVLLVLVGPAWGEIYRWVDEAGNVHFSDAPPEPDNAEEVALPPQPSEESLRQGREEIARRLQYQQDDASARREAESREKQARDEQQRAAAEREVRCAFARDQLQVLRMQAPVFRENEQGEREYADDAFRASERARFEQEASQYCD